MGGIEKGWLRYEEDNFSIEAEGDVIPRVELF